MRKKDKQSSSEGGWLTTYADLMTLLLAFFVLLFSMSSIEDQKYEMIINSLQNSLIGSNGSTILDNPGQLQENLVSESDDETNSVENPNWKEFNSETESEESSNLEDTQQLEYTQTNNELKDIVSSFLVEKELDSAVKFEIVEEGILLDVNENILFDLGKSEIKSGSLDTLSRLGKLFEEFDKEIRVIGHTDDIPISTTQYPSNWELGASRACAIVRYYIRQGFDASRFVCTSYGEMMPVASNETEEGRLQNRRVNFLIEAQSSEIKRLADFISENDKR